MTVPTSWNIISPTGECFTSTLASYLGHMWDMNCDNRLAGCQSSGLTRSTAKLHNTQNIIEQICPITPSSHHTPLFDRPQDFNFVATTNNNKTSSQTSLTHARSGPPYTHTHTPVGRKSQGASRLPGTSQCQAPVSPTGQIQSNLSQVHTSDLMMMRKSIYILSIIPREMGKLKTYSPTYCIMDNGENMLNHTHTLEKI